MVSARPVQEIVDLLRAGVSIVAGLVAREGALGRIESVYLRDPDSNLIEIATYAKPPSGIHPWKNDAAAAVERVPDEKV